MPNPSIYNANISGDDVASRYVDYQGGSSYRTDRGILVLPIAGPDGTAPAIIKVHSATGFRQTEVSAAKFGSPPLLPAPTNTPSGDILLTADIDFALPQISPNQNEFVYGGKSVYTYVQSTLRASGGSSVNYQTTDYPYAMELIDLGQQGVIGGSVAAVTANNPLHPLYYTYQTFYPANFFTTDTVK